MKRTLVSLALVSGLCGLAVVPQASGTAASAPATTRPDRVVVILVDALSREIVEKYDMHNAQQLMDDGRDTRSTACSAMSAR